ncbi:MAG: 3-oxoacyl-(acyl-carrier-protein) synthase [Collimonas fungivorans]|uniref:beta-ketoacyl synthase chain length factor n=1 Tax=Collimonas fungivorans TaxID=158899 RepID=UPI0026EB1472|nr:beta-ketoacyl synthase chain length factor [Collimonas fungivorans]MDB5767287.1 3-oxoacyl-(acyl-carrier-protein) synthase [Collimonas fungivorans]
MKLGGVRFSIVSDAAWAPGLDTAAAWLAWAQQPYAIEGSGDAAVAAMPAMLRRRAGAMGKMALEAAYRCLDGKTGVPTVFCSRHGECARSIELLADLAQDQPLSPTSFSLSVHNAAAGLFSIARKDQASHTALAAGHSGVEHAVIEACGLLADGAPEVLLVVYDCQLPELFQEFQDCQEQPFAWAWLMSAESAGSGNRIALSWDGAGNDETNAMEQESNSDRQPAGLDVLGFYLRRDRELVRTADGRRWRWGRLA